MKLALVNSIKGQINSVSATHASYLQSFSKTFMCILNKMTANFYSVTVLAGCWGRGSLGFWPEVSHKVANLLDPSSKPTKSLLLDCTGFN